MSQKRPAYWPVYTIVAGLWLSGALWLLYHHFAHRSTEFGDAPSPVEHWWLAAHGVFSFASLWLLGFLWASHIVQRWRLRRHRKTGAVLFGAMLVLAISGYLLYYLSSDAWRAPTAIIHWVLGLAVPLALLAHWSIRKRQ